MEWMVSLTLMALTHYTHGDVFIIEGPVHQRVRAGRPVTFRCAAGTDSLIRSKPSIRWLRDDAEIDLPAWRRFHFDTIDQSLTIDSTTSTDTGLYKCIAELDGEADTASAELIVEDVPDPPVDVELISACDTRVAEVRWHLISENYSPVSHFIIEYNTSFRPESWTIAKSNVSPDRNYQRIALSPWGNYSFRVIAVNAIGKSLPSPPTTRVCRTPPDVPHHNPGGVCARNVRPHVLFISWQPMPEEAQNAPGFYYVVKWREQGSLGDLEGERNAPEFEERVVGASFTYLEVENQPIYAPYDIFVLAMNEVGEAVSRPKMVLGYSGEDVPLEVPQNFRLDPDKEVTSTTADFIWDNVMKGPWRMQGFFRGFKIQFWKTSSGFSGLREHSIIYNEPDHCWRNDAPLHRYKRHAGSGSDYKSHLYNLWPYTNITAHVLVLNTKYEGPPSIPITFMTSEGVPSAVPHLTLVQKWPDQLKLQWSKPVRPNGVLVGYTITYGGAKESREALREEIVIDNSDITDHIIPRLRPDQAYRISIRARTQVGTGAPFMIEAATLPGGPPVAPNFTFVELNSKSVNITWFPTGTGNPGTSFKVQYRTIGHTQWIASPKVFTRCWFILDHLVPSIIYQVRVVAYNGDHANAPFSMSPVRKVYIGEMRELIPPKFKVEPMKDNTIGVRLLTHYPAVSSFYAQYRPQGSYRWLETDSAAKMGWSIIRHLVDGKKYEVRVVVQSDYGEVTSLIDTIQSENDPAAQASVGTNEHNGAQRISYMLPCVLCMICFLNLFTQVLQIIYAYLLDIVADNSTILANGIATSLIKQLTMPSILVSRTSSVETFADIISVPRQMTNALQIYPSLLRQSRETYETRMEMISPTDYSSSIEFHGI